ncbi:MAG: DUF3501 family protein [Planctomycetes bacterium]|nr:DUF3501 family protein [Planctomycetota bacterium]
MMPLTLDDLIPLEEYAGRRREYFDSHRRYVDRYRRVRIGPRLTLVFENRQTLWFRIQEIVRIARIVDPVEVRQELDLYNRLLPGANLLQAALLIAISDESKLFEELAPFQNMQGDHLRLCVGRQEYAADLITSRPEDRAIGTAHWVQFPIAAQGRAALTDFNKRAAFVFDNGNYHHACSLGEDVRQSLLDDLSLSDRDMLRAAA